jgi:type VI secretion system protein ImpB
MSDSIYDKKERVRKPRVHIKYEVETEGGVETRELPFVVGVMGDFSGNPTEPLKPLRDRKFVDINRDNFNEVLAKMTPGLNLKVKNTIQNDGTEMPVNLKFQSMDDFQPARIVQQVKPLEQLMDTRNKLRDLQAKADLSNSLDSLLEDVLKNTGKAEELNKDLNAGGGAQESNNG